MDFKEIANEVILIGSVGTAVGIIIKLASKPIRRVSDKIKKFVDDVEKGFKDIATKVDDVKTVVDEHTKELAELKLDTLGLIITDRRQPDEKRYRSSKRYIALDGNSGIDIAARKCIEEYEAKYESKLDSRLH